MKYGDVVLIWFRYLVATKADMVGSVDEMNALVAECEAVRDAAGFNGLLIVSSKDDVRHSVKKVRPYKPLLRHIQSLVLVEILTLLLLWRYCLGRKCI